MSDNFIYNWQNNLKTTQNGLKYMATKTASDLKDRGLSRDEALELLVADKYDLKIAESCVNEIYDIPVKKAFTVPVIPTSYEDVKHVVEHQINKMGSKEFLKLVTSGKNALVKLSSKRVNDLESTIKYASENPFAISDVHKELRPWVENALLDSVLLREQMKADLKPISEAKGIYEVKTANNTVIVDLLNGTSTGKRFTEGSFAELCIPDEYLIFAADKALPHGKIFRDLAE